MNLCSSNLMPQSTTCDQNYIPSVKKLLLRRNKNGEYQVKENGKGKWIKADYDPETGIVKFTA